MSQAKLTLRPPPNVEFVHGYPGIPPSAPNRPQAAVKGALELRVGLQGIKAKWVRIELRKVETLPGGGQLNVFHDFVGQSPVNLWQASDDYALLHTQDFPFYIRIPESIPPSLALEKGSGIRYELIATACLKGKKGFFRRDKSVTISTSSQIVIDKHELHSTWPIYCQPEIRNVTQEGVNLTVERHNTCYGPGDRVSVTATVKSDTLHTIILRGFEFVLREHTVFRAGAHTTGKKAAPQVRVSIIGDQKVPVNVTLYGGSQHKVDLTCMIPQNHTSATLTSARHIDITYHLGVKALMGTNKPLAMDLPVIVSNWPRSVSAEAIRRIGPASSLSLITPYAPNMISSQTRTTGQQQQPWTVTERTAQRPEQPRPFNTAPINGFASSGQQPYAADELGYNRQAAVSGSRSPDPRDIHSSSQASAPIAAATNGHHSEARPASSDAAARRRPRSGNSITNRFTITNLGEGDLPEISPASSYSRLPAAVSAAGSSSRATYLSAEEEKKRLYERAKADVERTQESITRAQSPPQSSPRAGYVDAGPVLQSPAVSATSPGSPWPSSDAEKVRLYNQAQASVRKAGGYEAYSPPSTAGTVPRSPGHAPTASIHSVNGRSSAERGSPSVMSPGAVLYSQAMSSVNRNIASQSSAGGSSGYSRGSPSVHAPTPKYPTAEQEKEMLKQYQEAKAAVDRRQISDYADAPPPPSGGPIAYDALYPSGSSSHAPSSSMLPPTNGNGMPHALDSNQQTSPLSEKEQMRRYYEAQDAAAAAATTAGSSRWDSMGGPDVPAYSAPVTPPVASSSSNALSEKETLRRKYAAQDAASLASSSPPRPPPRSASITASGSGMRSPPPLPPGYTNGNRPLTAAEEKALLKAQYEAEEQSAGPSSSASVSFPVPSPSSPPPPPPLMPRPPADYIQETQEEDARVLAAQGPLVIPVVSPPPSSESDFGLDVRPFSPFHLPFSSINETNANSSTPPPPPLPPKLPL